MHRKVSLIYPKGTCKAPAFYFRGGDGLSEPEDLRIQHKAALDNFNKMKIKLTQAQIEYNQSKDELDDLDDYLLKIATNMGQDSTETTENANLRARIKELESEIADIEKKIDETKQNCLPLEYSGLINERAQYKPSLRDLRETNSVDSAPAIKRKIGELLLSKEFSESVESLIENHVALEAKSRMRSDVSAVQNRINEQKSADTGKVNEIDDDDFMMKLEELRDVTLDALESQVQLNLAKIHRKIFLKMEIDRLDEMNEFLTLMGNNTIDTSEVYQNCIRESEEEENENSKDQENESEDKSNKEEQSLF